MARARQAPGGGVLVEVPPDRVAGWLNRFGLRNGGLASVDAQPDLLVARAGDGTTATLAVPFPPMSAGTREPVEALLAHLAGISVAGLMAVRAGAFSVGVARDGAVVSSRTDRPYVQGRTAAGGWSQQRYARRRANQLTASLAEAAQAAATVLVPVASTLDVVVLAGDPVALRRVLADRRLEVLADVPRREFPDIPEPRRTVLDDLAARCTHVLITVRPAPAG